MQANYPFFKQKYSRKLKSKAWGNYCVHCQALQEEDDEFVYGIANPLSPITREAAKEIRIVYFSLGFDYYMCGGASWNTVYGEIIN